MVTCGETCPPGFNLDSSSRLSSGTCIFLDLFYYLTGAIFSVADDVLVDNEAPVVTLSISRICRFSLSEVRVRVFIEINVRACI
jgi:hypothetical protein